MKKRIGWIVVVVALLAITGINHLYCTWKIEAQREIHVVLMDDNLDMIESLEAAKEKIDSANRMLKMAYPDAEKDFIEPIVVNYRRD